MTSQPNSAFPAGHARSLLQRLRDLNLVSQTVRIYGDFTVSFQGCCSLDAPVEQGVQYRIKPANGEPQVLTMRGMGSCLEICIRGHGQERTVVVPLLVDQEGRALSPALSARLDPQSTNPRDFEHFMRRIVRGVLAA